MVNFEMVEGARQVEQIVRRYMDCGWQVQALRKSYDECAHIRKNIPFAKSVGGTLVFDITTRFYAKQNLAPEPAMDPRGSYCYACLQCAVGTHEQDDTIMFKTEGDFL